jgi:TPR repeat protein
MTIFNQFRKSRILNKSPSKDNIDSDEQFILGVKSEFGYGVAEDFQQAVNWYTKSSKQGNIKAQAYLAWLYAEGKGVERDYEKSLFWYNKAANQGDINAKSEVFRITNLMNKS